VTRVLQRLALWGWFLVFILVLPGFLAVGLNILLVRQGFLEGIAPWQLLLSFAAVAYLVHGVRDRLPLWQVVSGFPDYRRRQQRRNAAQLLRVARRALARPWYRSRIPDGAAEPLRALTTEVRVALRADASPDDLEEPLERLELFFDRHLGFMKFSIYVEYGIQIGLAVLAAFVLRESVVEAFKIPSGSMLPTLEVGDHIFVNKLEYGVRFPFTDWMPIRFAGPRRGDVIVFAGMDGSGEDMIKRVVATAGDRLAVESDGTLRINGHTARRCPLGSIQAPAGDRGSERLHYDVFVERLGDVRYAVRQFTPRARAGVAGRNAYRTGRGGYLATREPTARPFPEPGAGRSELPECRPGARGAECVVPEGTVFVMGDNRDNSNDSRFWGTVPLDRIKGKAYFIWWSNADRSVELSRIGISIHDAVVADPDLVTEAQAACLAELARGLPDDP
jgi:signal peptidase I